MRKRLKRCGSLEIILRKLKRLRKENGMKYESSDHR